MRGECQASIESALVLVVLLREQLLVCLDFSVSFLGGSFELFMVDSIKAIARAAIQL